MNTGHETWFNDKEYWTLYFAYKYTTDTQILADIEIYHCKHKKIRKIEFDQYFDHSPLKVYTCFKKFKNEWFLLCDI